MINLNLQKEEMIRTVQNLKCRKKLIFHQNIIDYYDQLRLMRQEKTFQFEGDCFRKGAQSIASIMHEVDLLVTFMPTKPQTKDKKRNY